MTGLPSIISCIARLLTTASCGEIMMVSGLLGETVSSCCAVMVRAAVDRMVEVQIHLPEGNFETASLIFCRPTSWVAKIIAGKSYPGARLAEFREALVATLPAQPWACVS